MKKLLLLLGLPVLAYLIYCVTYVTLIEKPVTSPVASVQPATLPITYRHDPQVAAIMDGLGLDYSELNLVVAELPNTDPSKAGEFNGTDTIYIKPDFTSHTAKQVNTLLSHEYLHFVQAKQQPESQLYASYMYELYETNAFLHNRVKDYASGAICNGVVKDCLNWRELEAYSCTELPDYTLQQQFIDYCNKYLPKRSGLFN